MHCAEGGSRYPGKTEVPQTPPCPVSRAQSLRCRTTVKYSIATPECYAIVWCVTGDKVLFLIPYLI